MHEPRLKYKDFGRELSISGRPIPSLTCFPPYLLNCPKNTAFLINYHSGQVPWFKALCLSKLTQNTVLLQHTPEAPCAQDLPREVLTYLCLLHLQVIRLLSLSRAAEVPEEALACHLEGRC